MSALPPLVHPGPPLRPEQYARYSRQMLLPEIGTDGQRRLLAARVLVVGAGGLGSPVLQYLAAAGIGHLTIVDDDVVELSNLHRQVIHRTTDAGVPKVDSAARAVRDLNPDTHIRVLRMRLDADSAPDLLADHDVVVDGTDNFPTRYLVADTCASLGVPEVWGSVLGFDAQVSVFWDSDGAGAGVRPEPGPGRGRTLRDLFPTPPAPGTVPSCSQAGVVGALCGQVGAVMAMEVVKLVTGTGEPLLGRVQVIDALGATSTVLDFARGPRVVDTRGDDAGDPGAPATATLRSCPAPVPTPARGEGGPAAPAAPRTSADPDAVSVGDLAGILQDSPGTVLLDVREEHEVLSGVIPGALWVPLGDLVDGSGIPRVPAGADLVVYCAAGVRSVLGRDLLRAAGWPSARHLTGGIHAWEDAGQPLAPLAPTAP